MEGVASTHRLLVPHANEFDALVLASHSQLNNRDAHDTENVFHALAL